MPDESLQQPSAEPQKSRRVLRTLIVVFVLIVPCAISLGVYLVSGPQPTYAAPVVNIAVDRSSAHVDRGQVLVGVLCTDCHLDRTTGALSGRHAPDVAPEMADVYTANITQDPEHGIGRWTDGQLVYFLRTGVQPDGKLAPTWMPRFPLMSDDDLTAIVAFLRSDNALVQPRGGIQKSLYKPLAKVLLKLAWKPLQYPPTPITAPAITDRVTYGKYIVQAHLCYECHSADFSTVDAEHPELSKGYMGGGTKFHEPGIDLVSANLTTGPDGVLDKYTEQQFIQTLLIGVRPNATALRAPMVPMTQLTGDEAGCVYEYLKTVPAVSKAK